MRTRLFAYKAGSASAKALADALGIKRIRHTGSRFRPRAEDMVINWGSSTLPPELLTARVLNDPGKVGVATNKLSFFRRAHDSGCCRVVEATYSRDQAAEWIREGGTVVCRTKLQGNSGDGIVIAETVDELVKAPLYTLYKKKKSEWRVHISRGEVIFIQQKVRKEDVPDDEVNWKVRNHKNGFVFAHKERNPPADVVKQAGDAMDMLGLDFGAVDVIWNNHEAQAYVLEVNCAPGLEGTTLEKYAESFK